MTDKYILVDGNPVAEPDLITWGKWMQTGDRIVKKDKVGEARVSTVFLGLDHRFGKGPPLLYETMIFGGPMDGYQEQYATVEEAREGHDEALRKARSHD